MKNENYPYGWHSLSIISYVALTYFLGVVLNSRGFDLDQVRTFDIIIISIGTFRITRMLVYDKVFKFFRDWIRSLAHISIFNSVKEILSCPWCAGVWAAWFAFAIYFLLPYGNILVFLFAISAIGTFLQFVTNLIGIKAKETQDEIKYREKIRN